MNCRRPEREPTLVLRSSAPRHCSFFGVGRARVQPGVRIGSVRTAARIAAADTGDSTVSRDRSLHPNPGFPTTILRFDSPLPATNR